ncbi:MAG: hypothetical protein R3B06_14370 [Kofleriaceae bacterium]
MLGRAYLPFASLAVGLALTACGPGSSSIGDDDDITGQPCTGTGTQCVGNQYQECRNDQWVAVQTCAGACDVNQGGCVACIPGVNTCDGANVVACNADGTIGAVVETCAQGSECSGGACQRACSADGVDLIYVVDDSNNLLSFDPRLVGAGQPFQTIGRLSCPAGSPIDGSPGPATPFSMGIDRDAGAWVLYSSGQIFNVSTQNAACTASAFVPGQNSGGQQWDLFGMGFVTDTAGGDTDKLWLGGGAADASIGGSLGYITPPGSLTVTRVGALSTPAENSPELTGLGDATLWGFYPGISSAFVQEINKTSGAGVGPQKAIPGGLGGQVRAWAFAQWGGKFYIFVTTQDALGNTNSTVRSIDRVTGAYSSLIQNLPYIIVGAGVSTCAPVTIGRQLPYETLPLPIDGSDMVTE